MSCYSLKVFLSFHHYTQKNGVEKNLGFGSLSDYEKQLVAKAMPELVGNIKKGEAFAAS